MCIRDRNMGCELATKFLHIEITKNNILHKAFDNCYEIHSHISISKLFATVAKRWNRENFGVIEVVSREIIRNMGKAYIMVMNNKAVSYTHLTLPTICSV
eukprot:TRINITY_DN13380_c0_g1_i1.p2 TRINITY_DN13380_c0_g1~~TRINITY_DN13380_c0_g1_i1.p2  ORF type:complete len:100 (-),score=17.56 TRINITY_DN13380_c0_g1_i1:34-333(-)